MYNTDLTIDSPILQVVFMTIHVDTFDYIRVAKGWLLKWYIPWWRMALFADLKIRIGYSSYEISRRHHPTFRLFPSDILSPFIRHRFNNQRCSIAPYPLAFRAVYTHERTSFTHTTTTYTHKRKSFTHTTTSYTHKRNQSTRKNSSAWLICEPQMPHFVPPNDLFTNKFDMDAHSDCHRYLSKKTYSRHPSNDVRARKHTLVTYRPIVGQCNQSEAMLSFRPSKVQSI